MSILMGWLLILAMALPLGWFSFARTLTKIDARTWPSVAAEVVASSMYQRSGKGHDWCVKASIRYAVAGRAYTNRRPGVTIFGDASCDREQAVVQRWLRTLAPGNHVIAYYNPGNPAQSALQRAGLDVLDYLFCPFSIALLCTGIWLVRDGKAKSKVRGVGQALH